MSALMLAFAVQVAATPAAAQACCSAGGALTPARLERHQTAMTGVDVRFNQQLGNHLPNARFSSPPEGAFEQTSTVAWLGALRATRRLQLAAELPLVFSRRGDGTRTASGYGVGDASVSGRWDLTVVGRSRLVPGISLLFGSTLPTGRTPETAAAAFAADATGAGFWSVSGGVSLEELVGSFYFALTGLATYRFAREVGSARVQRAPELTAIGAIGYVLPADRALTLALSWATEAETSYNGQPVRGSTRKSTTLTVAAVSPLGEWLRARVSLALNPPVNGVAQNQPAAITASAALFAIY